MKQKREWIVLAALIVIAAAVWYSARRPPVTTATVAPWSVQYPPLAVDNPQLHWWKVEALRKTNYAESHRNIFSPIAPPTPQEQRKLLESQKAQEVSVKPPSLTVAIIPLKFFGYGQVPASGARRAFFTDGDEVFIVAEGEMLLGRFRVLRIGNDTLEYEEIANGLRGRVVMEEQVPGG